MSVFFTPAGPDDQQVSLQELRQVAARRNFTISAKDEPDFLALLQAADQAIKHVDNLPPYIDPRMLPRTGERSSDQVAKARPFQRPAPHDNPLNAWSHTCDIALPGATGPLAGRSVAVKDNVSVAGLPLTLGTSAEFLSADGEHPVSQIDASVVSRVLEAGGRIAGTATCENYSACALSYSSATGPVDNPWAVGHATGGSSSGCAALLAATLKRRLGAAGQPHGSDWESGIDLAIGGDQGGSIRLPAAYSGIYGLKPTHGLCPYTGIASLHPLMDHCGPMATSVADVALLLSVMAGYDGLDPRMTPETPLRAHAKDYAALLRARTAAQPAAQPAAGLRVGILTEGWALPTLSPEVAAVTRGAAQRFAALGAAAVAAVSVPLHAAGPLIWTAATRAQMGAFATANAAPSTLSHPLPGLRPPRAAGQRWLDDLARRNPAMANVLLCSDYLSDARHHHPAAVGKAHAHVLQLRAAYDAALAEFDVLVMPAAPTVAPPHPSAEEAGGVMERIMLAAGNSANTCPFNVTGHPALSMPVGWGCAADGRTRLPVGMQIVGRRWDEETVLFAAAAWEAGGLGLASGR